MDPYCLFQDPSVQQMTKKPSNIEAGLEDYNPFDPASQQKATAVSEMR